MFKAPLGDFWRGHFRHHCIGPIQLSETNSLQLEFSKPLHETSFKNCLSGFGVKKKTTTVPSNKLVTVMRSIAGVGQAPRMAATFGQSQKPRNQRQLGTLPDSRENPRERQAQRTALERSRGENSGRRRQEEKESRRRTTTKTNSTPAHSAYAEEPLHTLRAQ